MMSISRLSRGLFAPSLSLFLSAILLSPGGINSLAFTQDKATANNLYGAYQSSDSPPPREQKPANSEAQSFLYTILQNYIKAVLTGEVSGEKTDQVLTLSLLAIQHMISGQKQGLLDIANRLLPLLDEIDDKPMQAIGLASVGSYYTMMGFYKKAIEVLNRAVPLLKASGQRTYLAGALSGLGLAYYLTLERRKALEYFNQALTLYRSLEERTLEVRTLIGIASLHSSLGEYKEALDLLNNALLLQKHANPDGEAIMITAIGDVYWDMGDGKQALKYFHQAVDLCRAAKVRSQEANPLNKLGSLYAYRGEREKAAEYLDQALQIAQTDSGQRMEAAVLASTGAFYQQSGELHKASQLYTRALAIMQAVEYYEDKAVYLGYIGDVYKSVGEAQKALDYYNQALETFRLLENRASEAATLLNIGDVYGSTGEINKGLDYLGEALRISRAIGNPTGEARTLQQMGEFSSLLGDHQKALSQYNEALKIMRSINDRHGEGGTLGRIGTLHGSLGEKDKALSYLNRSLAISQSVGDQISEADALSSIGLLYERNGEVRTALGYYRRSIEKRERNRAVARLEEFKVGLASKDARVYDRAILLEMRDGQPSKAFDLTERARARSFLDQLGNTRPDIRKEVPDELIAEEQSLLLELALLEEKLKRESAMPFSSLNKSLISSLDNQLDSRRRRYEDLLTRLKVASPEYASLTNANTLALSEVQNLLGKDTTLLSYFVTPEKTLAFVIGKNSFQAVEIPVKQAELEAPIKWFRSFASLRDPRPQSLKQLYSLLIEPIKQHLKTPSVCIIPHGVLHYLPFAALTDGKQYLGDRHTIYYLPSASVLSFIRKKSKPSGNRIFALSQGRAIGLPVLRFADEEAISVAGLYGARAFTTGLVSKTDFLKRAGDYDILHIAAHAELNTSTPLFSRIMIASSEGDAGALEVREIYNLDLSGADLVMLSACNTQLGAISKGDDVVGLNRAFVYAGAPTVIASLWAVDDESTSYLMKRFYIHLKGGMSKAKALQKAQSEARKIYSHPYHWAAFVLNGDAG
jgi:CHAT domain-containing protein/lipopolysaccharide biosynthesis regulator YciM